MAEIPASHLRGTFDLVFATVAAPADLARTTNLAATVPEGAVRDAIRAAGLLDTKIAAFSATHTATKAVIPVIARPNKRREV
jgi:hypothetical protein